MLDFTPNLTPVLQDDSDFDSGGYKSSTVTALSWDAQGTVSRKIVPSAPTTYDPGQELLRTISLLQGAANSLQVRFYEVTAAGPTTEAWQGSAAVSWSPKGGAMDALDEVAFTLTGQGARVAITHPNAATSAPSIASISPTTAGIAGGAQIQIHGSYFTGATAVKIDAASVATANWTLINDGLIVFTVTSTTAGPHNITVVTPAGTSNAAVLTTS
jgi:hypothetical protein